MATIKYDKRLKMEAIRTAYGAFDLQPDGTFEVEDPEVVEHFRKIPGYQIFEPELAKAKAAKKASKNDSADNALPVVELPVVELEGLAPVTEPPSPESSATP